MGAARFAGMASEVADVWDAEAEHFDDEPDHGLTTASIRDAWADLLRTYIPENRSVLDLGCGTGSLSVLLAEYGHAVTGVDLSPRMLSRHGARPSVMGCPLSSCSVMPPHPR